MRWLVPDTGTPGEWEPAYDWPSTQWVRACMVMGLDGSISGPDGLSGSISSATDRQVLSAVRRFADAYLVGARTIREEGYSPVRARTELVAQRRDAGQLAAPTLAVVSASCTFDWDSTTFQHSENRPIILTVADSDPEDRASAARWCDVVVVGTSRVDPRAALDALAERGLTRVTCEGGDSLFAEMIRSDALDEVDLTLSPTITAAPRPARAGTAVLTGMRLHHLLEEDGFLFARYLRSV